MSRHRFIQAAVTATFVVASVSMAACTHKVGPAPADATCQEACAAIPSCNFGSEDGCLNACESAQANCAAEYRQSTFQDSLACLITANYSCSEEHDGSGGFAVTNDCASFESEDDGEGFQFGCPAQPGALARHPARGASNASSS
jgi:hypothetical protein